MLLTFPLRWDVAYPAKFIWDPILPGNSNGITPFQQVYRLCLARWVQTTYHYRSLWDEDRWRAVNSTKDSGGNIVPILVVVLHTAAWIGKHIRHESQTACGLSIWVPRLTSLAWLYHRPSISTAKAVLIPTVHTFSIGVLARTLSR